VKEEEIRPRLIFDEYLRLAAQDTKSYFSSAPRESHPCPACGCAGEPAFAKDGFEYERCPACFTLFVNPRPVAEAFNRYYTESPSAAFWASTFYKETAAARREKLWKPKAKLVRDKLQAYGAGAHSVVDIGGGYGIFAEEMRELSGRSITVIEPGHHLATECRSRNIPVVEKFLEHVRAPDLPGGPLAFVSFELFEHLHDPAAFLEHTKRLMSAGDLFLFTTLSGTGVDIQVLWSDSKAISPPHHLNFFNPTSIATLLGRHGLPVLEVTTPGQLDVDILVNNSAHIKDRFWQVFVAAATSETKRKWQALISESGWSSHMMVVCRKP
jgi:hypothetical protein